MVFSSLTFLYLFLPITLLIYFLVKKTPLRNAVLVIASLFFYAWGEPKTVFLLIITVFIEYIFGILIENSRGDKKRCKMYLSISIAVPLVLLGIFKYLGFFAKTLNIFLFGLLPEVKIALPIGISFYTFQIISYVIDVYREKAPVQKSFFKLLLYISMFPQLIAGPIVRYVDIMNNVDKREVSFKNFVIGLERFIPGLAKKAILANFAGKLATTLIGGDLTKLSTAGAWIGIIAYTFQIYFDFSAYSDMAIGMGKMFGFEFLENFNYPYISKSITEFWRRWHISLSSFFKDYVYIPLGGNREHHIRNMLIVWALTGFWHGANWNFIFWGLYYFLILLLEKKVIGKYLEKTPVVNRIYSLFFIIIGWVFFYFEDLGSLFKTLGLMFGISSNPGITTTDKVLFANYLPLLIICVIACTPIKKPVMTALHNISLKGEKQQKIVGGVKIAFNFVLMFLSTAAIVGSSFNPFLYFRF